MHFPYQLGEEKASDKEGSQAWDFLCSEEVSSRGLLKTGVLKGKTTNFILEDREELLHDSSPPLFCASPELPETLNWREIGALRLASRRPTCAAIAPPDLLRALLPVYCTDSLNFYKRFLFAKL